MSPDGRYLAYLGPVNGVLNVWVAPVHDLAQGSPVTDDRARGIRYYVWSYATDCLL